MELPMALTIAMLYATGTYMILRPNILRIVMGFGLYSNATNLLMITIGGYTRNSLAPFVPTGTLITPPVLMDPLPPDIILTAIVISFAVGALMLIIAYKLYKDYGTDNPEDLPVEDNFIHLASSAALDTAVARHQRRHPQEVVDAIKPHPIAHPLSVTPVIYNAEQEGRGLE